MQSSKQAGFRFENLSSEPSWFTPCQVKRVYSATEAGWHHLPRVAATLDGGPAVAGSTQHPNQPLAFISFELHLGICSPSEFQLSQGL